MNTFIGVLAAVAGIAAWCALLVTSFWKGFEAAEEKRWRHVAMWALGMVLATAVGVYLIFLSVGSDDNARHCGPGTAYTEYHYGKHTDWLCVDVAS